MKILVTGSNGFIGSHLVDQLIYKGHQVLGIDDLSGGFLENNNKKAYYSYGDLRDAKFAEECIKLFRPQVIYHLAANAAENKAQFSPIDISTRNYFTFLSLIVPAINAGVKKVIVSSSIAVYGDLQTPFKETDIPQPEDIYGVSKLAMEQTLKILAKVHDFEYVITRPHNVYGPKQNMEDPYRNVVTIFMNALLKEEAYKIYGDGEQRRCFTFVDDVIDSLVACLDKSINGMTFNIGSDNDYSLNELSDTIQRVSGISIPPVHIEDRPQEVKVATADHTLAKQILGYKDSVSLEAGLRMTWDWCKAKGYQKPRYTNFEIDSERIPSNWTRNM